MSNNSRKLSKEYEQYTIGLALLDAVPVLLFLLSGIILYTMFEDRMFLAGVICCFIGGLSKVYWKFVIVLKKRNSAGLTAIFHVLMPVGFVLMALPVILTAVKQITGGTPVGQSILANLWRGLTMQPAMWCFIGGFALMCLMGYLGAVMDESARANWIEELVNTLAQGAILAGVILVYLGTFYHASDAAIEKLGSTGSVLVTEISTQAEDANNSPSTETSTQAKDANNTLSAEENAGDGAAQDSASEDADASDESGNVYFFDGPGTDAAFVFYPGAKVEASSYAPLMSSLSESGIDCYLCQMPENLALLDRDLADDIRSAGSRPDNYTKWFIGGHSLGGAVASMYLADCEENWDGLILLAAYPTDKLSIPTLSIYGTEDGVLNREKYAKADADGLWPEDFTQVTIKGGNHAGFGDYGNQKGDGTAAITAEKQQAETVSAILEFAGSH